MAQIGLAIPGLRGVHDRRSVARMVALFGFVKQPNDDSVAGPNLNMKTICQLFCPGDSVTIVKATHLLGPRKLTVAPDGIFAPPRQGPRRVGALARRRVNNRERFRWWGNGFVIGGEPAVTVPALRGSNRSLRFGRAVFGSNIKRS